MKKIILKTILVFSLICSSIFRLYIPGVANAENDNSGYEISPAWFDDALFVGDSQTGALASYTLLNDGLGNAVIYHYNGLACHHIIRDETVFFFKGEYCSFEDMISLSEKKYVFLMLALNDIATIPLDELAECWEEIISRARESCPGITLFIQSATPVSADSQVITKSNNDEYNQMLKTVCDNNSDICIYVDITAGMTDDEGYLKPEFQRDHIHLNADGCALWVTNLYNLSSYNTSAERINNIWGAK